MVKEQDVKIYTNNKGEIGLIQVKTLPRNEEEERNFVEFFNKIDLDGQDILKQALKRKKNGKNSFAIDFLKTVKV